MKPEDIAIAIAMLALTGGGVYVLVTVARAAVARWLGPVAHNQTEVSLLRDDVQRLAAEVSDAHATMADLQERVDFAERLLAKQRDSERLPGKP